MKSKIWTWIMILGFIFILTSFNVSSLGIRSPGGKVIDFEPGYKTVMDFSVTSTDKDVRIEAGGYHPDYITFSRDFIPGNDEDKSFQVTITLPDEPEEPGHQLIWVRAAETNIGQQGSAMSFVLSAGTYIKLNVLYKGPYIEAKFGIASVNQGDILTPSFNVNNFGSFDVNNIRGKIDIYDINDNFITTLNTDTIALSPWESYSLGAKIDTSEMSLGSYKAKGRLFWYKNFTDFEKNFQIGGELVRIINFTDTFEAGAINKVHLDVENLGNRQLEEVKSVIEYVGEDGGKVGNTVTTPSYIISPWSKITMEGFWDASSVNAGKYTAKILVSFRGGEKADLRPVNVTEGLDQQFPISINNGALFSIGLIILLLLTLIISFLYLMKVHNKRNE